MDVILVEHTGLGDERVLKKIRKKPTDGSGNAAFQLRRESSILKKLRHPGIPVIYDYWEDTDEICLIEEYVRGLSLQEYLLRYGRLDLKTITDIMLRLLDILVYLHGQQIPVIHQDLKTEHVIIRDHMVVLIDYGISDFLRGGLRTGAAADDIYAAGSIAEEMTDHCAESIPHDFRRMIRRATSKDTSARYATAAEWRDELYSWQKKYTNDAGRLLIKNIAVIGNSRGIGTTHAAVSITSYLNHRGIKAYYRNLTGRPGFLAIEENLNTDFCEKDGIIYHKWFRGLIDYGPAVQPESLPEGICVSDCGTDFSKAADSGMLIYMVGSRPWQSRQLMGEYLTDSSVLIVTPENPGIAIALARATGHCVISMPYDRNPMHPDRRVIKVYDRIFSKVTE